MALFDFGVIRFKKDVVSPGIVRVEVRKGKRRSSERGTVPSGSSRVVPLYTSGGTKGPVSPRGKTLEIL